MTKFWMATMAAILALGLTTTGCPDGDDCASDPSLCDPDSDTDSDAGSDADADADPETSDDGATDETVNCPNVAGDWDLTYRESESGMEGHYTLTLEQDGCLLIGWDEVCDYTGSILETGYVSLYRDCYARDRTVTGNFTQTPPHMTGDWNIEESPPIHGTWWADPQ